MTTEQKSDEVAPSAPHGPFTPVPKVEFTEERRRLASTCEAGARPEQFIEEALLVLGELLTAAGHWAEMVMVLLPVVGSAPDLKLKLAGMKAQQILAQARKRGLIS